MKISAVLSLVSGCWRIHRLHMHTLLSVPVFLYCHDIGSVEWDSVPVAPRSVQRTSHPIFLSLIFLNTDSPDRHECASIPRVRMVSLCTPHILASILQCYQKLLVPY